MGLYCRRIAAIGGGSGPEASDAPAQGVEVKITDEQKVFISESSVYRILKGKGLITTPAPILLSAATEFKEKTAFVHEILYCFSKVDF